MEEALVEMYLGSCLKTRSRCDRFEEKAKESLHNPVFSIGRPSLSAKCGRSWMSKLSIA